jgi:hypothetical protein
MKSRFLLWWMSFSASVTLFLAQKLNAVGQIIALGLEGSYPGATGYTTSGRKRWKSGARRLRVSVLTWYGATPSMPICPPYRLGRLK